MAQSSIEWTEMTWNPTTGCSKISQGCKYCYAEVMSKRLQAMGVEKYRDNFEVRIHPESLLIPYTWKSPKIVFVNLFETKAESIKKVLTYCIYSLVSKPFPPKTSRSIIITVKNKTKNKTTATVFF